MSRAYGFEAFGGPETEIWFDRDEPTPGPSELVIAVHAFGVNPVDFKIRSGVMTGPDAQTSFPQALGNEASGVVTAVGSDVDGFSAGDEVFGPTAAEHGAYAEHAVLSAAGCVRKPQQVSHVDAAALPVAAGTAWDCLERLAVAEGGTLLLNGAGGGVGVAALQLARDRGIAVFATASESKRPMVESLGATLIPYDTGDVVEQVRAILPGGVDAVLDAVGGESLRAVAILVTDPQRIVSIADAAVEQLGGSMLVNSGAGLAQLAEMVAGGKLDPKVTETYAFDDAPQALRAIESGHVLGKIVVDVAGSTKG